MKAFTFVCVITFIVLPLCALGYLIYNMYKWDKKKKQSDLALKELVLEYQIKAEQKKDAENDKSEKKSDDDEKSESNEESSEENDGENNDCEEISEKS